MRIEGMHAPVVLLAAVLLFGPSVAEGAEHGSASQPARRSDILERRRQAKLDSLGAPTESVLESILQYIETGEVVAKLRYGYYGFYPTFGGLSTRARTVLGIRYQKDELLKNSSLKSSAAISRNVFQKYDAGFTVNRIASIPLGLEIYNRYRNYPQEEHFGLGPDSQRKHRSDFRLEDYTAALRLFLIPTPGLEIAGSTGYLRSRSGAGTNDDVPSVEERLPEGDLTGFTETIEHWLTQFSVALDLRDSPGNPRSGVFLVAEHKLYEDQNGGRYDFQFSSAEFQGYIPFLHKHRVVAFRAHVSNAEGRDEGVVPFYSLPYVGGGDTIRGFREYRFRDSKLVLANVEYRFEAFIGLDAVLFGDFGQVAGDWEEFRTSHFESAYGGGLRFNTARSVFLRFDVGHGHEGTRFYLAFSNVF